VILANEIAELLKVLGILEREKAELLTYRKVNFALIDADTPQIAIFYELWVTIQISNSYDQWLK